MSTNGHLLFSISSLILANKLKITEEIIHGNYVYLIIGNMIGAIFPDIDHKQSNFGKFFYIISIPINKLLGHRGCTHSLTLWIFLLILSIKIHKSFNIPNEIIHGFLLGYFSHLIADMLTKQGIPLFWPYKIYFSLSILKNNKNDLLEKKISILLIIFSLLIPEKKNILWDLIIKKLNYTL